MRRFLILSLVSLLCTASSLYAQVPQQVSVNGTVKPIPPNPNKPEAVCNSAGTFTIGQGGVTTQSNDLALPVIYLCYRDSVFINHNGDSDLTGDAEPTTPPGVAWAIYRKAPTVIGDKLQNVVTDPEIILGMNTLPVLAFGDIGGDIWFRNFGFIQTTYNSGQPGKFFFAPITVDNFDTNNTWESAQVGFPPGPCVNVNTADAFEVVYLNEIVAEGLTGNAGNDCLGRFVVKGGLPQYDKDERYTIDIYLASDPTVKALIYTPVPQYLNGQPIQFSVTVPGQYVVRIEDGRSCGLTTTVDMSACNSSDNLTISFPDTIAPPNTQLCIPIQVENFQNLVTTTFTLEWNELVLQYDTIKSPNPALMFNVNNNLNEVFAGDGKLGLVLFKSNGSPITILPSGSGTLIQVCFNVIGNLGDCTGLTVTNNPSAIGAETANSFVGMTIDTGSVCVQYLPLLLKDTLINPTCTGEMTLRVTVTGGNDPYNITWAPLPLGTPVTSGVIATEGGTYTSPQTLPNGDYRVCVQDDNGFGVQVCDTITVSVPILGVNLAFTQPKCFGDSTGIVTANVLINGVAAPDPSKFTYDWAPAGLTTQGVPVQNGVPAGTYTATITDPVTGCFQVAQGSLSSPSRVSSQSKMTTPADCAGVENGTISYIATGGTPFPGSTYEYTWSYSENGNLGTFNEFLKTTDNPLVIASRAAGFYQVTITDANGCTFTDALQIAAARTVSIDLVNLKGTNCAGGFDGSISIAMSANPPLASPSYSFIWAPAGVGLENSTATTSVLSQLPPGTYGLQAIEGSGCADTATFVVTAPPKLVLDTVDLKNPTCLQPNSGTITVSVAGGTPVIAGSYAMFWDAPLSSGNNIYTQSNLGAGMYTVRAVDSKGCRDSLEFNLALPPAPVIQNVVTTPVKCGKDGCLEAITNAVGAMFTWQILDSVNVGNTAKVCNLDGGQFVLTIKDANSCVVMDTFSLTPVVPLSIDTATLNIPKCFGDANGSIIPTISGGQPQYQYKWNDPTGSILPALNQIKAGKYTLTVTDLKGCTTTETFDLLNPPSISAQYINAKAATCSDSCDGGATITVGYSDGKKGDFVFNWSGTPASADSIRTDLCPGTYTVSITAAVNSCFTTIEVIVGSPLPIDTTNLAAATVTCNGGDDGSATIAVNGGTSPYKFRWSSGALTATASNLEAGLYAVTVTDNKGCTQVFSTNVPEPAPIVIQPDLTLISLPKCFGNADGTVAVTASGGNPGGYKYQWKNEATGNTLASTNPVDDLKAGYYSVTVTDPKGCTGELDSLLLSDPAPVLGSYKPYEPLKCFGDETILTIDQVSGGAGAPYQYSVDNGATLPIDVPFTIDGGSHTITYTDRIGCEFTETLVIPEPAEITVKFDPDRIEIELGDSTFLKPIVTGAAIDKILWAPATVIPADTLFPYAKPFQSTMYTLTVSDANGCSGTGKVTIIVDPNRNVYIPNVFIPSNDAGTNYAFNPYVGNGVKDINYFQVYDRWGTLMYERTNFIPNNDNFGEGWDGKYKGDYVNPGVFIYVVEVDFLDGRTLLYRGDVTVVR